MRSQPASPGAAQLLRATAESISLVARTDGPVILLLDEAPGRVLEVPLDHPKVGVMIEAVAAGAVAST